MQEVKVGTFYFNLELSPVFVSEVLDIMSSNSSGVIFQQLEEGTINDTKHFKLRKLMTTEGVFLKHHTPILLETLNSLNLVKTKRLNDNFYKFLRAMEIDALAKIVEDIISTSSRLDRLTTTQINFRINELLHQRLSDHFGRYGVPQELKELSLVLQSTGLGYPDTVGPGNRLTYDLLALRYLPENIGLDALRESAISQTLGALTGHYLYRHGKDR